MAGKPAKRAARSFGGMVRHPPLSRAEAEAALGQSIPEVSWVAISQAFVRFGYGLYDLEASTLTGKKDDPNGWLAQQSRAVRGLEAALDGIQRARGNRRFLREAEELYSLREHGASASGNVARDVDAAFVALVRALAVVERAQPFEIEVASEAELRRRLAGEIGDALTAGGVEVRLSDGRSLEAIGDPSEADLSGFERLLSALGVHEAETPAAFARWVRRALGQIKGTAHP